ncbi:hypothetical protein Tcur_4970 [Thermomonospora curvata DSM 43183]|mgnify:CR=1 FL=1|uniref:Uncharacterized protein n=1 Tax=Thermomonospora curvata (strain ATCC 19995 / DSM 43183 / JCM 3096 / KCTC 9072 / NBRC 15933 / NCIMB 10081 / Henssen B9) TaxID=471852 RepID=D1A955_THECD|nr:hypothetical protein Tcur_4970 [Thermomonospora curvata DSM 43183]
MLALSSFIPLVNSFIKGTLRALNRLSCRQRDFSSGFLSDGRRYKGSPQALHRDVFGAHRASHRTAPQ